MNSDSKIFVGFATSPQKARFEPGAGWSEMPMGRVPKGRHSPRSRWTGWRGIVSALLCRAYEGLGQRLQFCEQSVRSCRRSLSERSGKRRPSDMGKQDPSAGGGSAPLHGPIWFCKGDECPQKRCRTSGGKSGSPTAQAESAGSQSVRNTRTSAGGKPRANQKPL